MALLNEIGRRLNFTVNMTNPADLQAGKIVNNSWTGMIGGLVNGDYDFMQSFPISYDMSKVLHHSS